MLLPAGHVARPEQHMGHCRLLLHGDPFTLSLWGFSMVPGQLGHVDQGAHTGTHPMPMCTDIPHTWGNAAWRHSGSAAETEGMALPAVPLSCCPFPTMLTLFTPQFPPPDPKDPVSGTHPPEHAAALLEQLTPPQQTNQNSSRINSVYQASLSNFSHLARCSLKIKFKGTDMS